MWRENGGRQAKCRVPEDEWTLPKRIKFVVVAAGHHTQEERTKRERRVTTTSTSALALIVDLQHTKKKMVWQNLPLPFFRRDAKDKRRRRPYVGSKHGRIFLILMILVFLYLLGGIVHILFGAYHKYSLNEKDHAEELFKLLSCAAPILEKRGVRYTLDAGSLLGSVRDNKIIDGDSDVDIVYLLNKYDGTKDLNAKENLRQACREIEIRCDAFALSKEYNAWDYGQTFPIDSWRRIARADWRIYKKHPVLGVTVPLFLDLYHAVTDGLVYYAPEFVETDYTAFVPNKDYVPFRKTCTMYDVPFYCPRNPEIVVELTYGKNWRVPKRDFRHHDLVENDRDSGA